jgi:hypothetical protein
MNIRSKEIYVSGKTKKRLYWLLQLDSMQQQIREARTGTVNIGSLATTDEIAEFLLNQKIESDFPQIKVLEKRLDALEGQLISELLNPTIEK